MSKKKYAPTEDQGENDRAVVGDNSPIDANARQLIGSYVARVERLASERDAIGDDIKQVFAEAKSGGFDVKLLRRAISERRRAGKMSAEDWENEQNMLDIYLDAARGAE